MPQTYRGMLTSVERLELELIVRDFTTVLNEGDSRDLAPFLHEQVLYRASSKHCVRGRASVMELMRDIRATFVVMEITLESIGVADDVVMVEQVVTLALPGTLRQRVMGFASFRFRELQIAEWRQLHA